MALSRGARFIVVFILLAATASVAAMVLTYALATRGPSVPMRAVLWLRVPGNLAERVPDDLLGQIAVGRGDTIGSVVDALRKASVDDRVEGVVLIPPAQPVMWGTLQELRDAMLDFRTSGKPLLAYLEYGGSQQYYLATAADRVLLTPTSPLDLVGVASYELFARDALDRFGVYPDMLHAGDFKTATNLFTETTFTPEHREMTASLNHDFYEQLVAGIADGREMSPEAVRELIDDGPFLPEEAVSRGLVDGLAYEDQLLQELSLDAPEPRRLDYASYRRVDPGSLGLDQGPRIAAVYALGAITLGEGGYGPTGSAVMGSASIVRAIRAARDDAAVEAIVLRVDSPGGAAIAADIIWREIELTTLEKPVVVSMADMAASGGYYIAAPADVVVAQPGTLTGSIGVFGGKLSFGEALGELGVNVEAVADGAMADMHSTFAPYSDEARARVQRQIDGVYETFLARVAEGRGMTRDEVHALGQGRVWTGQQAKERGLVDELGGMRRALELAKGRAGLDVDQEVTVVVYPRPRSFFEVLNDRFGVRTAFARWLLTPSDRMRALMTLSSHPFRPGEPLALMPPLVGW